MVPGTVSARRFDEEQALPMATCSLDQVVARAIAAGVPVTGTYIRLWYGHDGAVWRLSTEDANGEDFYEEFADGC